jgi:hypothetical protein
MIPGLIVPAGNLGGLNPHQVICCPIAAVDLAVGDLVMFDLWGSNSTYTDVAQIAELDHKKNPFNVVVKSVAGVAGTASAGGQAVGKGGIFAVVVEAATAGNRVKVCLSGLVDAKVTTVVTTGECTAGRTVLFNGVGVLTCVGLASATATGAPLGIGFTSVATSTTTLMKVLFNGGYAFSIGGA